MDTPLIVVPSIFIFIMHTKPMPHTKTMPHFFLTVIVTAVLIKVLARCVCQRHYSIDYSKRACANKSEGAQAFCRKHPDLLHSRGNLNPVLSGLILIARLVNEVEVELVSKELNHLAAILHVYAGGLNFMK